jgi:hypothetical protein
MPWPLPVEAHDREHLGLGGRRVLVSRKWSGKTLSEHKADRATVVREALLSAGMVAPEIERLAASVRATDGLPRFVWTDEEARPCQLRADDLGGDHRAATVAGPIPGGCGYCFSNWPAE